MSREILEDLYKDTPRTIPPTIRMKMPNENWIIYEGELTLKAGDHEVQVNGKIEYSWFPNTSAVLSATLPKSEASWNVLDWDVFIDGLKFGRCGIVNKTITNHDDDLPLRGIFLERCVLRDKSVRVSTIDFSVPNLRRMLGETTITIDENGGRSGKQRAEFLAGGFRIIIDSVDEYDNLRELLTWQGGYINLYGGRITREDGKGITYDEITHVMYTFGRFISFLNARRTEPIFWQGKHEDEIIWEEYSDYHVDTDKVAISWLPRFFSPQIAALWSNFYDFSKDKDDDFALDLAIHWYCEVVGGSGYLEGSTIMAQTALELLYNWILIEGKQILKGNDAANISAANKIRLLLAQMNINYSVPAAFKDLQDFVDNTPEINDAPEATVYVRNAIVHAQLEKRKKLADIPVAVRQQAIELTLWYIEMSILYALGYNGRYIDRRRVGIAKQPTLVPWVVQLKIPKEESI